MSKVAKALAPSVIYFDEVEWTFLADKKKVKTKWSGEKPPSRFMKDMMKASDSQKSSI